MLILESQGFCVIIVGGIIAKSPYGIFSSPPMSVSAKRALLSREPFRPAKRQQKLLSYFAKQQRNLNYNRLL